VSAGRLPSGPWVARPVPADLAAAENRTIPDVLAPGLSVLFSGLTLGLGITNVVARATVRADELSREAAALLDRSL
jgi:hypothetical protein